MSDENQNVGADGTVDAINFNEPEFKRIAINAARYWGVDDMAEEVAQETLRRLVAKYRDKQIRRPFGLIKAMSRLVASEMRRKSDRITLRAVSIDSLPSELKTFGLRPDDHVAEDEDMMNLDLAMTRLSLPERMLVEPAMYGLSQRQIAEATGMAEATVSRRKQELRDRLRQTLESPRVGLLSFENSMMLARKVEAMTSKLGLGAEFVMGERAYAGNRCVVPLYDGSDDFGPMIVAEMKLRPYASRDSEIAWDLRVCRVADLPAHTHPTLADWLHVILIKPKEEIMRLCETQPLLRDWAKWASGGDRDKLDQAADPKVIRNALDGR